jgi:biopolymer transport protein ExbD
MPKKKDRGTPEINASSMADIAFLLLVFFLVATNFPSEKGIPSTLPRLNQKESEVTVKRLPKNIMTILVNSQNQLLVREEEMKLGQLKEAVVRFIDGADKNEKNQCKGVISLKGDRGTKYESYIQVLDQVKAGYTAVRARELKWTEEQVLNFKDTDVSENTKKLYNNIIFLYPVVISEADPTEAEKK